MKRTQIQIPERLYREIQRGAVLEEWTIAEVIRRRAEEIVRNYPPIKSSEHQNLLSPINGSLKISGAQKIRDLVRSDQERESA